VIHINHENALPGCLEISHAEHPHIAAKIAITPSAIPTPAMTLKIKKGVGIMFF
jgi:hypothetical protein